MKRILLIVLVIFLISGAQTSDTLVVGFTEANYPYSFRDSTGSPEGIFIGWWELWGKRNNHTVQFVGYPAYDSLIAAVQNDAVNAIAGLYFTEERAKLLQFGDNIVRSEMVLFVNASIEDTALATLSVPVYAVKGDFSVRFLQQNHAHLDVRVVDSYKELTDLVTANSIDAFVHDYPTPIYENNTLFQRPRQRDPLKGDYPVRIPLTTDMFRTAVKRGNDSLANIILVGAANMTDEDIIGLAKSWDLFTKTPVVMIAIVSAVVTSVLGFLLLLFRRRKARESRKSPSEDYLRSILQKGETDFVEFKSSLRYDYRQHCSNKALEKVIVKTISAFMNTKGGTLIIGVDDDGKVLGLENDYQSLNKKNADGFLLGLTSLINTQIGKKYHRNISLSIIPIDNQEICWVVIQPSSEPVFIGKAGSEEFFIRASVSSQPLSLKECYEYIRKQWR